MYVQSTIDKQHNYFNFMAIAKANYCTLLLLSSLLQVDFFQCILSHTFRCKSAHYTYIHILYTSSLLNYATLVGKNIFSNIILTSIYMYIYECTI